MTDVKKVWISTYKKIQTENQSLCVWCSCTAGAYETCNHVTDYANTKRFCNPSCTEQACAWKQGTKKKLHLKTYL